MSLTVSALRHPATGKVMLTINHDDGYANLDVTEMVTAIAVQMLSDEPDLLHKAVNAEIRRRLDAATSESTVVVTVEGKFTVSFREGNKILGGLADMASESVELDLTGLRRLLVVRTGETPGTRLL